MCVRPAATCFAALVFGMRLQQVHDDVLVRIMQTCDQRTKTSAMLACKALYRASMGVGAWTDVTFKDLDVTAVEFMKRHKCRTVTIRSDCPDDVAWFFDRLRDDDVQCIEHLRIELGLVQRVPRDLLMGLSSQTSLLTLTITVEEMDDTCEVSFPPGAQLARLTHLTIHEAGDAKQLVVWFADAQFPSLRCLDLELGLSDVVAVLACMPSLRTVRYIYDDEQGGETMEDARFGGLGLDSLELAVGAETSYPDLWRELEKSSVKRLVLHVMDDWLDLTQPMSPDLEELTFVMYETHGDARVDFPFLRELKRLRLIRIRYCPWIVEEDQHTQHTLVFAHAALPAWTDLVRTTLTLDLPPTTRITISPM